MKTARSGQSLIELVVALGIGVLFVTAAIGIITFALRLDVQNRYSQTASELNQQILEQVTTFANNDWHNIDLAMTDTPYHFTTTGGFFSLASGSSTQGFAGTDYRTSFMVQTVYRDPQDAIVESPAATADPSTFLIIAATAWDQGQTVSEVRTQQYLTRGRNRVWPQTDWSTGSSTWNGTPFDPTSMSAAYFSNATNTDWSGVNVQTGQLGIFSLAQNLKSTSGNGIHSTYRYAYNDIIGWLDFRLTGTVTVGSTITGYARNINASNGVAVGYLALDCATSPAGNVCNQNSTWKVVKDTTGTSAGILSGYGWNDAIGWVSFNCSDQNTCATTAPCPATNTNCTGPSGVDYNVRVDSNGDFYGWAWNDVVGWISFNCDHSQDSVPGTNYCQTGGNGLSSDYHVKTGAMMVSWAELESIPFNTLRAEGAGFNTIMWQGTQPTGTAVKFQIATGAAMSYPYPFLGPDGTSNTFYEAAGPNVPVRINRAIHNNDKYMAYRVILESDAAQQNSPVIDDIILNWSH